MKKLITIISVSFLVNITYGQDNLDSLHKVISSEVRIQMQSEVSTLKKTISKQNNKLSELNDSISALKSQLNLSLENLDNYVCRLDTNLTTANNEIASNKKESASVQQHIQANLTYLFGALCLVLFLVIIVYWLTNKKHTTARSELAEAKTHLEEQISNANAEFAEKLLETLNALPKPGEGGGKESPADNQPLILDFAQQIASMENNIWHLPEKDGVRKRIERATKKMRDTFKSLGYDMPKLLGTEILDGQSVDIRNKSEDSSIEPGKQIVALVVTPQVLFNGKTIKRPTVDIKANTEG